jgi:[histone H3]-lysine36 N-dimethyltransferase SETMAR
VIFSSKPRYCLNKFNAAMADNLNSTEQRYAIKFMQKEGATSTNVYARLKAVYGSQCMSRARVFVWFKRFRDGRKSTDNNIRSGRPATAVNDENIARVDELIRGDRRLTVKDIMRSLGIGAMAVNEIIHDRLGFSKVCARWVPRQLTPDNKETRFNICADLCERYSNEGDGFLHRIITGDETWIHQFEPESKRQSMQWRHVISPPPRKFKMIPATKKIMATVFWDAQGILLVDFLPNGQTINANRYIMTLKKLKRAVRRKRLGLQDNQILL